MGNSSSSEHSPVKREWVTRMMKLWKQIRKHNPIRISYLCRHGKCKRVCDMYVSRSQEGAYDVSLGETHSDGIFVKSHFVTTQYVLTDDSFVLSGCTPNGSAVITIKKCSHCKHFLEGHIVYRAFATGGEKIFPIHVHLGDPASNDCTEYFVLDYTVEAFTASSIDEADSASKSSFQIER